MPDYSKLLQTGQHLHVSGVPQGAQGYVLAQMARETGRPIIHITNTDREMDACATACRFFAPDITCLTFPAWDCMPYDRVSPAHAIIAERISTLTSLTARDARSVLIVITTVSAIMQKLPPRELLKASSFEIRKGKSLLRDALLSFLAANGYSRVSKVMEPGEFAVRGSIIDIFAAGGDSGTRIDLFDDEVESIKLFDPLTQISHESTDALQLRPVSEVMLNDERISAFRTGYRERFGAVTKDNPLYESISEGRHYAGMEHWLPLFYDRLDTLFDYMPNALVSFDHQAMQTRHDRLETLQDYYQARQNAVQQGAIYHPLRPDMLYLVEGAWEVMLARHACLTLSPFKTAQDALDMQIRNSPDFAAARQQKDGDVFAALRNAITAREHPTLVAAYSAGSAERLQHVLKEQRIPAQLVESWKELKRLPSGMAAITVFQVEHGFELPEALILTEQDILGERIIRTQKRRRKSDAFMSEAASYSEGELVVHKEHGIGRFEGLVTMDVNHLRHDCLKLVYAGDDKLFLPVENIDMISRFGSEAEGVQLDKLGSVSWQKRKSAMKQRIRMAAEELLSIAAKRATREAAVLVAQPALYEEFCNRFPYSETEDQLTSIEEVLADLAAGTPMDRLICGDVGFGKTEVAMRAAFVACAADTPVQVALIAPTTLLARQHYQQFKKRFDGLPITVKPLSRLVGSKEASATKEGLAEGKVDIIIGTHALLSKSVQFKNLGLVIVDEEQHFGVAQKEKLKRLRTNTHVLTLSATPIPRTLQMALSGVRELSLITTPPVDRLAVRSFVLPFDELVIREAILREFHRGGKSFYVTPRIKYMAELKTKLQELVPEIKIAAAHGQMSPSELDRIMNEFYDGKYDLLLSTAIIESGLDVPTANTMIIDHAEMFGLAQLYQLRGRVGRGKIRAYAYFTLPHRKTLTAQAMKRLEVMQTLDTLGAGFTLASHDMDIRGFGNLLGEEQSGHVREVGIELYQHMLEEAIESMRSGRNMDEDTPDDWSPHISLGTSVLIPESYVEDLSLRMGLYRRLASFESADDIRSFAAELIDRFGPLPQEVEHLIDILYIKQLCKRAGIERLDAGPKGVVFSFRHNVFAKPDALISYISQHTKQYKIRADQKLVYMDNWRNTREQFTKVNAAVEAIAALAA